MMMKLWLAASKSKRMPWLIEEGPPEELSETLTSLTWLLRRALVGAADLGRSEVAVG